ncbi:hypothetical protein LPJ81_002899 [Coemansia sp. IMI 209127]|nr:hypothetical protein LPJ81_002899 [Coemansia sp. IMI 209127]
MVIVEILGLLTNGGMHTSNLYLVSAMDSDTNSSKRPNGTTCQPTIVQGSDERKEANRRMCIICILERLFCQPHVLVGISVMDVLNVLVTFLLESVVDKRLVSSDSRIFSAILDAASTGNEFDISSEQVLQETPANYYHLLAAIGGLARHHYYNSQMTDMVVYLVQQMQLKWSEIGEDYWKADAESVNRILCKSGNGDTPATEIQNSANQVKDIRARVSVDWEAQARRDSILAPHVNIDQLRAALRDGLSVHSSEQLGDLGLSDLRTQAMPNYSVTRSNASNPYSASGVATARSVDGNAVIGDEYGEDLDMYGHPVPDDVRDLLDSIDNDDYDPSIVDVFPQYGLGGRSREGSSTISTPVIGNVE